MITLEKFKPVEDPQTKRRQISQLLRNQILSRSTAPGQRISSTQELARQFGVSYTTMHHAMNDLVRDGCLVRHRGKGTFASSTMEKKKRPLSSHLVIALPVQEDIELVGQADETMKFLRGCTQGSSSCGAQLAVVTLPSYPKQDEMEKALDELMRHDGALFVGDQYSSLMRELDRRGFPAVALGRESVPVSSAGYDLETGVRLGVTHLLEHGYRRIGFFGAVQDSGGDHSEAVKHRVFRQALEAGGIPHDPSLAQHCSVLRDVDDLAGEYLKRVSLPRAVFVDNPQKAIALVRAAKDRGLEVPKDFAVLAYGADTNAMARDGFSIVEVPYEAMGQEGAVLLDKLVRGAALGPVHKVAPIRLIVRRTCGCIG